MAKANYIEQSTSLSNAIDIAIESIRRFPPPDFEAHHINHFTNTYLEFKRMANDPEPQYRNMKNLSSLKASIFTYFQEENGEAIEYFWKQVKEQNLGFTRENKLKKILERGRIKNKIEYDFIVDVLVPYQQEGLITEPDVVSLNQMLWLFEKSSRKD